MSAPPGEAEIKALVERELLIRRARTSLAAWCIVAGPTELGPFVMHAWQRDLCAVLEGFSARLVAAEAAFAAGEEPHQIRAEVEVMTQAGKTEIVLRWIAWHLARHGQSIGVGSYAADLAGSISIKIRTILRSQVALRVFPHLARAVDEAANEADADTGEALKDTSTEWSVPNVDPTKRNARLIARGRRGGLNGRSVWAVVCDDLLKDETEYNSSAARDEAWRFVRSQAETRLQTRGGLLLLVGSRWGNDDPLARMRENTKRGGLPVEVYSYPLRARAGDRMGRAVGEYLIPGFTAERERQARAAYGEILARALLDCDPVDEGSGVFKRSHLSGTYPGPPNLNATVCEWTVLILDGAETAGGGDWSVLNWYGKRGQNYLLLGQWRQQIEFPELLALCRRVVVEVKPSALLVEVKSSGKQAYQVLSRELRAIGLPKTKGKRESYIAASVVVEAGAVLLPAEAPSWLSGWVERVTTVTGLREGEVDDEADNLAAVILWDQGRSAVKQPDAAEVARRLVHGR